jgi:hypothetical protein
VAPGDWMSGAIFDLTGSYRAAFMNGIAGTCSICSTCSAARARVTSRLLEGRTRPDAQTWKGRPEERPGSVVG